MSANAYKMFVYQCSNPGMDWNTTNVGGTKTGVKITGSTIGESFFMMFANSAGGGAKQQTAKQFVQNDNADDAFQVQFWIENLGTQLIGTGYPRALPLGDFASETMIRFLGYDATSSPLQSDRNFSGTGISVTANDSFSKLHRAFLVDVNSGVLVLATEDVQIYDSFGNYIGKIPKGCNCITWEYKIGVEGSMDGSSTISTPASNAPVTLYSPNSATNYLAVPGGTVPAGSAAPIWIQWVLDELAKASKDITYSMAIRILGA